MIIFALIVQQFAQLSSQIVDKSQCSSNNGQSDCSYCIPYSYAMIEGECAQCDTLYMKCEYCSQNGCEQCIKGFTLFLNETSQMIECFNENEVTNQNCNKSLFYGRFGDSLSYCINKSNPSDSGLSKTGIAVIISILSALGSILIVSVVFIIIRKKLKVNSITSKSSSINSITQAHINCSYCNQVQNVGNKHQIECGGFLCTRCFSALKISVIEGKKNCCTVCQKQISACSAQINEESSKAKIKYEHRNSITNTVFDSY